MVDYAQLGAASGAGLRRAADAARLMARELEQYGTDTDRHRQSMAAQWVGADATAAGQRLGSHAQGYRTTGIDFGKVDEVLSALATGIDAARQLLQTAVSAAPSIPGSVGTDGTVHVNFEALGANPSPAAVEMARQRGMQVAEQIRQALTDANQADQEAQRALIAIGGGSGPAPSGGGQGGGSDVPEPGTDPKQVNQWWNGLTPQQQQDLIGSRAHDIGRLDGVPVLARDQANRLALSSEYDELIGRQSALEQRVGDLTPTIGDGPNLSDRAELFGAHKELRDVNQRLDNISSIQDQLGRTDMMGSTEELRLIDYDSAADGRLVMSAGNPDVADNVVSYVPGMSTDVEGIDDKIGRTLTMQADAAAAAPGQSTASVMWLDYDAPDGVFGAASPDYYENAAGDLTSFQHGLRATHEGDPSLNTLLGHSYGSSTVGYAASHADLDIDNLVFVASPGSTADSAGDMMGLTPDHVWATRGESDIIQLVPDWPHGNDPVHDDFGGQVFDGGTGGHSDYWDDGNVSRTGFADIITGQYDQVPREGSPEFAFPPLGP